MPDLVLTAALALPVFLLATTAQAATGFGSALIAVPLLATLLDPATAVVAATTLGVLLTAYSSHRERGHVDARVAALVTACGVVAMPAGLWVLTAVDARALSALIAVSVLVLVALLAVRVRLPTGRLAEGGAGVLSGFLLTSTGMNGPPVVLALQAAGTPPRRFRATLQAVFLAQDLVATSAFAVLGRIDASVAVAIGAGAVAVPVGWFVGDRVFAGLSQERFRAVVLGGLVVVAVVALAKALT